MIVSVKVSVDKTMMVTPNVIRGDFCPRILVESPSNQITKRALIMTVVEYLRGQSYRMAYERREVLRRYLTQEDLMGDFPFPLDKTVGSMGRPVFRSQTQTEPMGYVIIAVETPLQLKNYT